MTENEQQEYRPISFAGGVLAPYRHVCAFINSRQEEQRILDPFVQDALATGDTMMYVVDPRSRASVVSHLRHLGFDASKLLAQRRCEVRTWADTYLRGGHFDQDQMIEVLDEVLGVSASPRIRMIIDMGWAAEERVLDQMLEYEARANLVQPKYAHVAICLYDTAKFGGDVLIDALRTHPMALIGGVLQVNPFFTPMTEFVAELRARDRRPADD